ncbi:thiol-activated cytolysin, partial [Bacillus sp. 491mf]
MIFLKNRKNTKGIKLLACLSIGLCTFNYTSISFAETPKSNSADQVKKAIDIDTGI